MNFLALCQSMMTECGVSGTMSTTAGQTGSLGRVVNWIGQSWNELQMAHDDWNWMRSSNALGVGAIFVPANGQFTTPLGTAGGQVGITVDSFGKWDRETFRSYTTTVGPTNELFLEEIQFDTWRDTYLFGANRNVRTRPVVVAIGPDESVNLGPPPNGDYTITADYFLAPSTMVADTDTPTGLPTRFHMLIVYKAMFKYAAYESAPDVTQRAQLEYGPLYTALEAIRLPRIAFGGALA